MISEVVPFIGWILASSSSLVSLDWVDSLIIAFYFVFVLAIGFYLLRFTKTGEDFFLAGRKMTMWIARAFVCCSESWFAGINGLGGVGIPVWNFSDALVLGWCDTRDALSCNRDDAILLYQ